ncbi:MAG TPA: hypothetical protein HA358_00465 [Candidatus Poseidoniaceae archaeon]|nr:hypothetical protein [Candidatus Poseidoniaceae archaeon]
MMERLDRCKEGIEVAMNDDSFLAHITIHLTKVFEIHPSLFAYSLRKD